MSKPPKCVHWSDEVEDGSITHHDLQVNGQDLSKSTHEDAVEAFRTAKEPIVVEVLRRVTKPGKMKTLPTTPPSPTMVTVATQTDECIDDGDPNYWDSVFRTPTPPPTLYTINGNGSLVQPSSRQPVAFAPSMDVGLTDIEMANGMDYEDMGMAFDDDRVYEMEYEEVTLERSLDEKVGLTLCYGSADEDFTDIFVSEIEQHSVAARDGRIHEGDQILQINGVDVHSREQAIRLFADNRSDITLLLARPQMMQMDDGFMEEQTLLDDIHFDMLEQQHNRNMEFTAGLLAQGNDEEGGTTDTATTENSSNKHEKDSGVGRTDESTKNDESSEQEIMENECTSPGSTSKYERKLGNGDLHLSNDSFTSTEAQEQENGGGANEISEEECQKFREVLNDRCSSVENSPHRDKLFRKDSQSSIEREIAALNKEMEQIQMECQEIVEAHQRERSRVVTNANDIARTEPYRSPRMVPRMGTKLDYIKQMHVVHEGQIQADPNIWIQNEHLAHLLKETPKPKELKRLSHEEKEKDTSGTTSAYNSGGDSCRSTPLTLELNQVSEEVKGQKSSLLSLAHPKASLSDSDKMAGHSIIQNGNRDWNSDGDGKKKGVSKSQSSGSFSEKTSQTPLPDERAESLQNLYAQYADVMYTNRANLEHTIMVQQKLFQQQLLTKSALSKGGSASPSKQNGQLKSDKDKNGDPSVSQASALPQLPSSSSQVAPQMEWVVKRRADGSRYITRRPIRNKLLKERARKVAEERSGLTTDDDCQSELKVGRYWSKEDRKKHLEKARDYKKRKEMIIKQKMDTVKESEEKEKKEPNIVELSHRKMMKHKGKKVFDNFTTLQEVMAHGSRDAHGQTSKSYNPLLSVTTV